MKIWISIRLLNIYNRKLKMFVEFHNKSMNCCRLLFFCRVAMQKKGLEELRNENNVKRMQ